MRLQRDVHCGIGGIGKYIGWKERSIVIPLRHVRSVPTIQCSMSWTRRHEATYLAERKKKGAADVTRWSFAK